MDDQETLETILLEIIFDARDDQRRLMREIVNEYKPRFEKALSWIIEAKYPESRVEWFIKGNNDRT